MLLAIRHRVTSRAGRLLLLLLALSLWPMASFGAMTCCPDADAGIAAEVLPGSAHAMHGGAHGASATATAPPAMTDCHEVEAAGHSHTGCDAECVARCATPSLFTSLGLWPALGHAQHHRASWHAAVPPLLPGARLLRPPIHV